MGVRILWNAYSAYTEKITWAFSFLLLQMDVLMLNYTNYIYPWEKLNLDMLYEFFL